MSVEDELQSTVDPVHLLVRAVWSAGDLALIDELVTDDYVHSDVLLPDSLEGPAAFREWVETVREGTPDMTKTVRETYVDGDTAIVVYTASGTHEGDIFGIAPTGRSIEVDGVVVSRVTDGRLVESTDVWDAFGLFAQLGTFPEVR